MANNINNVSPDEAQEALQTVANTKRAGWQRAVPDRYFGAGVAILIASQFALYALEDPYPYIAFPVLGLAIFITFAREKSGAYGREFPSTKANVWALGLLIAIMLVIFFGSIVIRRTYDAAWVSLVAGSVVGLIIFLLSENERHAYLAKAEENKGEGEAH